ncbi:MAG: hypothetical protein IJU92_09930 [Spirochaetaceae bacterium]|nr:hypothetical protein [Spirochaetaceae bacterium]
MNFLLVFFEIVRDFFSGIFFANSEKTIHRKQLKSIFAQLQALPHPPISKEGVISSDFARVIFRIYAELLPVKSIFEQTLLSKDIRVSTRFLDLLLTSAFSEAQEKEYASFSYIEREKDLQSEATSSLDVIQRHLNAQVKRFHAFQNEMATDAVLKMDQTIQHIFRLYDFCCYDFETFFIHFEGVNAKPLNELVREGAMPKFTDVQASDITKELLDLNFVLSNLEIDQDLIGAIQLLHEKIAHSVENKFLFVLRQISTIKDIIDKEIPKNTVLNIIRYAKGEPTFEENMSVSETSMITDFNERWEKRFQADSKKLLHLFQESKIENLIKNTFGARKFFTFSGYNEEVNKQLQAKTTLSFDWIRPMELLRSFTKQNFDVNMKTFLKTILVEGTFSDPAYQKNLSTAYYYCEGLSDSFEQFERMFSNGQKCSLQTIEGYLAEIDNGGNFEKHLERIVTEANVKARQLVQTSVEQYTGLYSQTSQLVSGSKKYTNGLISNLKQLFASAKFKPLIRNFENDVQLLGKFLEIMKNYAILSKSEIS